MSKARFSDGGDEEEDLEEYGVRIFRFLGSVTETVEAFYETVLLFKGALKGVPVPKVRRLGWRFPVQNSFLSKVCCSRA